MAEAGGERCSVRIVVSGRVQGVGYRAWFAEEAHALGLDGWVRNRRDGTVEAVLAGAKSSIAVLVERARNGPPLAVVHDVAMAEEGMTVEAGFEVRRTA